MIKPKETCNHNDRCDGIIDVNRAHEIALLTLELQMAVDAVRTSRRVRETTSVRHIEGTSTGCPG